MLTEILVIIAAVLGSYQGRRNLWQAICLVALFLPAYVIRVHVAGIPTNALELLVAGVAISVLFQPDTWPLYVQSLKNIPTSIKIWIGLFFLATCVSTLISSHVLVSLGIVKGWILVPLVYAALIYGARPTAIQKQQLLDALIASASVVSLMALIMGRVDGRLQAFYDTPNSLALYVAPVLAATLWQAEKDKQRKSWLIAAAAIQVLALIGAQSVGAGLAVFLSLCIGISAWLKKGKVQTLAVLLVAALIGSWIFWQSGKIPYLLEPLKNPQTHNSATVRLQLWSISWDLIKEHPLVGIGLGQFEPAYQQKLTAHLRACHPESDEGSISSAGFNCNRLVPEFVFRDPHNLVLSFWLNTGLLGLVSFISLNSMVLKRIRRQQDSVHSAYFLILISYLAYGLVDTIYWKNDLSILWWAVIAIVISPEKELPILLRRTKRRFTKLGSKLGTYSVKK